MGNALFESLLQCVSRYTATRLVLSMSLFIKCCNAECLFANIKCDCCDIADVRGSLCTGSWTRGSWYWTVLFIVVLITLVTIKCSRVSQWHILMASHYLSNIVQLTSTRVTCPDLRSSSNTASYVTPHLRTKFGEHAFLLAGPASWNSLLQNCALYLIGLVLFLRTS